MSKQHASSEWFIQRITAVIVGMAILFGTGYIVYKITIPDPRKEISHQIRKEDGIESKIEGMRQSISSFLSSPFIAVSVIFVLIAAMYHGAIGMKIIIEDYIKNMFIRKLMTNLIFLVSYFVIGVGSITILTTHIKQYISC